MNKMKMTIGVGDGLEAIKEKAKRDLGLDIEYVRLCDSKGNIVPISHIELVPKGAGSPSSNIVFEHATDSDGEPSLTIVSKKDIDVAIAPNSATRALENLTKLYGEGITGPALRKILEDKFASKQIDQAIYYVTAVKQSVRRDWSVKPNVFHWNGTED